ncbi:MAG: hypothetical protein M3Z09_17635 [Acidobacteriota bacterium]|nr:hypothetical protein [Acidobacteriota bacterium]
MSRTYVACLDCGKEFDYSWDEMRVGAPKAQASAGVIAPQTLTPHHSAR